ncbi:LysM peptidoglycan-binding domain-containing M23 family metallopeptidase [Candidatus Berkelbacteria bacterium]|nr:LysM peptidoglycan-binding domain-containing M23 family metallopeptidase [Candidatus Berkelbacteria bacterium]
MASGQGVFLNHPLLRLISKVYTYVVTFFLRRQMPDLSGTESSFASKKIFASLQHSYVELRHFVWNQVIWQPNHRWGRFIRLLQPYFTHIGLAVIFLFALTVQVTVDYGAAAQLLQVTLQPRDVVHAIDDLDPYTPLEESKVNVEFAFRSDSAATVAINSPETVTASKNKKTSEYISIQAHHRVVKGETVSTIASRYGLRVASVLAANDIPFSDAQDLKIGEELDIPKDEIGDTQAYLDFLDAQQKQREVERQKQLAEAKKLQDARSKRIGIIRTARAANESVDTGDQSFGIPAGGHARNGYHWWAADISGGGSTIVASADGVVGSADSSGYNGGYGKFVTVDHGGRIDSLYSHLSQVLVSPGQRVSRGQQIGVMGATGRVSPAGAVHLHFEIRRGGLRLNPCQVIGGWCRG